MNNMPPYFNAYNPIFEQRKHERRAKLEMELTLIPRQKSAPAAHQAKNDSFRRFCNEICFLVCLSDRQHA
jgi:hypothetical protein